MDPTALSALAAAVGSGLMNAMTTDAWQTVKSRVAKIIARGSERKEDEVIKQLEASQARIQASSMATDRLSAMQLEEESWGCRLNALLANDPSLAPEFEYVLRLIRGASDQPTFTVTQRTFAGRDAYTAGADQYISIRPRDDNER